MGRDRRDGRDGEGEVSSRVTWDQGGQDSTTQKEGFQVSKGELTRGVSKGLRLTNIANLCTVYICTYIYIISMYECS
jgi:hypothetical protein